jgi:SAM-dependent methyltransferase
MNAAALSMSMSMAAPGTQLRQRPSLRMRLRTWLARKSRARLARAERELLARCPAATGQVLALDGLRGLPAGRLARLAATPDASVDTVVSVGALAEAADVAVLLIAIKRVLRPGGRFLFVEPVAAPAGTRLRRVQRAFDSLWRFLAGTVRAPRDLWNDLKTARFDGLTYAQVSVPGLARLPVPHLVGEAIRIGQEESHPPAPAARARRSGALEPGSTLPAFAFFG